MRKSAKNYYAELRSGYTIKIRQLVPKYDEMIGCIVDLLKLCSPATVLDIGAGVGSLSLLALRELPAAQLTAVEVSEEMISEAREALQTSGSRVSLVHKNILDFSPEGTFDAIFTNLVLHNIAFDRKQKLISRIEDWLSPTGTFIWGDLIRYGDPRIQGHYVRQRIEHARSAGCPEGLIEWNFQKETGDDFPLTMEEIVAVARSAGFDDPQNVWTHDTFAVFVLRKKSMPSNGTGVPAKCR